MRGNDLEVSRNASRRRYPGGCFVVIVIFLIFLSLLAMLIAAAMDAS